MNQESSTDTCMPPCVKQVTSRKLPHRYHMQLSLVLCDDLQGWDREWEGGSRRRGHMYI